MTRCFVGLLVPSWLREKIKVIKKELGRLSLKCKFVEDENLHICLSFLGELDEEYIKNVSNKIDKISKKIESFEVKINGIKMIPNEKYIRVLALDILDKTGSLKNLNETVQKEIGGNSKPPHLTVCRVKTIENKGEVVEKIKEMNKNIGILEIDRLQLIKSELRKTGPIYTIIHEAKFGS